MEATTLFFFFFFFFFFVGEGGGGGVIDPVSVVDNVSFVFLFYIVKDEFSSTPKGWIWITH